MNLTIMVEEMDDNFNQILEWIYIYTVTEIVGHVMHLIFLVILLKEIVAITISLMKDDQIFGANLRQSDHPQNYQF